MTAYNLVSFAGIFVLAGLAWLCSSDRKVVNARVLFWGVGLQLVVAFFIFVVPAGARVFLWVNDAVMAVLGPATAGVRFVFGIDAMGNLVDIAEILETSRWKPLKRRVKRTVQTEQPMDWADLAITLTSGCTLADLDPLLVACALPSARHVPPRKARTSSRVTFAHVQATRSTRHGFMRLCQSATGPTL